MSELEIEEFKEYKRTIKSLLRKNKITDVFIHRLVDFTDKELIYFRRVELSPTEELIYHYTIEEGEEMHKYGEEDMDKMLDTEFRILSEVHDILSKYKNDN